MRHHFARSVLGFVLLCAVSDLGAQNNFQDAGYLYLSPVPGASYVSQQTRYVLVRFLAVKPSDILNLATDFITVTGYLSGPHPGATHVASDGRTVIFETGDDFVTNELATVTLNPEVAPELEASVERFEYEFMVTGPMPSDLVLGLLSTQLPITTQGIGLAIGPDHGPPDGSTANGAKPLALPTIKPNGVSVPDDFPQVSITVNNNPTPGCLFLENGLNGVPPYTMILDNDGLPVWYRRGRMYDFKIQKNGLITWCLSDDTGFPAFDQNFNYLKTYATTNGYLTDGHELKIMADGTYYLIGYRLNAVDMSQYILGGSVNATVRETVLQQFTAKGELIFQWRAWDHYDLRDLGGNTDFPHMNGIDIDEDGNLLVSARHLSEVTKIDRDSGEILWRLSGPRSSFHFENDPFGGTSFQHDVSALGNGHYMVFDNGNAHTPDASRAVEYQLDLTNWTARLVWQFRDTPDKFAYYLGSAQRLTNGNTLINFVLAKYPKAIEVDDHGVKRFELSLVPGSDAYRAFRFPWNGIVAAPYLVIQPQPDNITLLFNKFGDTNVAYYRIYGGPSPHPADLLAESGTTLKPLYNLQNGLYYFRVTAVNKAGVESPFSNEESVNVSITRPGQNMIRNGDFSADTGEWAFSAVGGAAGAWAVTNGTARISIGNGGTAPSNIQLAQAGITLVRGNKYVLDFDAWSSQTRYIQVKLVQSVSPFVDYSQLASSFLTPNRAHYRYIFTMNQPSDYSVILLFQFGASDAEANLEHVSLFSPPLGDLNLDGRVDLLDLGIFGGNWLIRHTGLPADFDGNGRVDFNDLNQLGGNWGAGPP